ncbi:polysaccharide biosynthesis/export family protein [Marivita sp. GX14005]|uniref:polysaccharide biosynthesis/export family protein n=1 Tax=Marivita sp. GX14005 TaxID=2942276 RepID=UPI00201987BD|nr:polysaccharide biosynthesis/export family protein [Marivita sp. GX14005]MCL3881733.1 polysaccharide biosynthesis/export family protein [Marivita sp. GX14005]
MIRMVKTRLAALTISLIALCGVAFAESYRLGPEDVVSLRAVAWNDRTASFEAMDALIGDYVVSSDGSISIPFAGTVMARGATVKELGETIAARLQAATGLYQPPQVWLQIAAYRPFYMLGDIANPGAYPWRPGLTASKALALAGGLYRTRGDAAGDVSEYRQLSSLRGVQVDLVRLRARQARLEAEQREADAIDFPETLVHPDGPAAIARIKAEERAIFGIRRESEARDIESNKALIALYRTELAALEAKLIGVRRQLEGARERVENLRVLVERGTVVTTQLINAERTLTDLSAEELDLNTAIFRARQGIGETERDVLQAADRRQHEIVTQLQDTRHKTELATKREAMFLSLAAATGLSALDGPVQTVLQVRREIDGEIEVIRLASDDPIEPGDVFEVSFDLAIASQ